MDENKVKRINELSKKSKETGLTTQEKEEQAKLRQEYIMSYKRSLVGQLENTYYIDDKGNKRKLERKTKNK